jgi:hypothetical protein
MWQEEPQKTYQNTLGNLNGYKGKMGAQNGSEMYKSDSSAAEAH